jgi:serine/threonine protein kinase
MEGLYNDLEIVGQIGKGCWSVVKQAYLKSTKQEVAVKIEISTEGSLLLREAIILRHLQGIEGVPLLYHKGSHSDINYMVMQRLKCTLDVLRSHGQLKVCDVLQRAQQLISTISQIHKRGIIHQDLQPKNLMVSEDSSLTYFIDFGLAASIFQTTKNPRTVGMIGTPSFSSLSALLGIEQDYKDDLEALGYNFVWLISGKLPWEKYAREGPLASLKTNKFKTPVSVICQGCPDELIAYFSYVKGLRYKQIPDYQYLRGLFELAALKLQNITQIPESFCVPPKTRCTSEDQRGLRSKDLGVSPEVGRTILGCRSRSNLSKNLQIPCNLPLVMPTTSISLEGHLGIKRATEGSELLSPTTRTGDQTINLKEPREASLACQRIAQNKSAFHSKKWHSFKTPKSAGLNAHKKRHIASPSQSAYLERSNTPKRAFTTLKYTNRERSCISEFSTPETPKAFINQKTLVDLTHFPVLLPSTKAKIAALKAALR